MGDVAGVFWVDGKPGLLFRQTKAALRGQQSLRPSCFRRDPAPRSGCWQQASQVVPDRAAEHPWLQQPASL